MKQYYGRLTADAWMIRRQMLTPDGKKKDGETNGYKAATEAKEENIPSSSSPACRGPDFIIVGAMKGGTESMVGCLRRHPEVWMPEAETHYFDRTTRSKKRPFPSDESYQRHFDSKRKGTVRVVGEKTPVYMHLPTAMSRIKKTLPAVKLIVVLRNPTERAWSHWKYWKRDPSKFMSILDELSHPSKRSRQDCLKRGFYDEHLSRITVWRDPVTSYNKLFRFLGVSEMADDPKVVGKNPKQLNKSPLPVSDKETSSLSMAVSVPPSTKAPADGREGKGEVLPSPKGSESATATTTATTTKKTERVRPGGIDPEARAQLEKVYSPHNERLFKILGYRIREWGE